MGTILIAVGGIVCLIGGIWFLIVAFRESVVWGLLCLFVPFAALAFLIKHFGDAAKPFGLNILGSILLIIGSVISQEAMI